MLKKLANAEIARCVRDFPRFARRWLKILTKGSEVVPLKLKPKQVELLEAVERDRWVLELKARQVGSTTGIAALYFHKAWSTPNFRVLVVAHKRESAEEIFLIYQRFYDQLPDFLKWRVDRSNVRELRFFHGGRIKVTTAGSDEARSTTWNAIHGSEFAFWRDVRKAVAALLQTATDDACVVLETTANGPNEAQELWFDPAASWKRFFVSWLDEPTYVRADEPDGGPLGPDERTYATEHRLAPERANWYAHVLRTRCAGSQETFDQEFPATPTLAFVTSGRRFFSRSFDAPIEVLDFGIRVREEFREWGVYSAGVDTASGEPGAATSAVVILDVTDPKSIHDVAVAQVECHPDEFSEVAYRLVSRYRALAVVETNSYGTVVLKRFTDANYDHVWIRTVWDKVGAQYVDKMGWWTDEQSRPLMLVEMNRLLASGVFVPADDALRQQIGWFVYNNKGKPKAASGKRDDVVLSCAMAVMGLSQIDPVREAVQNKNPRLPETPREVLEWEERTGKIWMDPSEGLFGGHPTL